MAASQHDVGMIVGLQAITSADVVAKLLVFETRNPEVGIDECNQRILIQLSRQDFQRVGTQRYFDVAGFPGRTLGLDDEGGKQKTAGK